MQPSDSPVMYSALFFNDISDQIMFVEYNIYLDRASRVRCTSKQVLKSNLNHTCDGLFNPFCCHMCSCFLNVGCPR